jgi:glutathione S-transferase
MILYQFPGGHGLSSISPPCMKIEMALRLIGASYEVTNLRSRSAVKRVSRTGRLPVLEIDGERIADSIDILDELERRFPDSPLSIADPTQRAHDRLWEHLATDHAYFIGYYLRWVAPENRKRMLDALFYRAPFFMRWGVPLFVRPMIRRANLVGVGGKSLEQINRSLERCFDLLETGLAGGPFLQGRASPARGDLASASLMAQGGFRDTMPDFVERFDRRPALVEHTGRVLEACSMKLPDWLKKAS